MALKAAFLGGFCGSVPRAGTSPRTQGKEGERSGSNPGFQQPEFHFLPCHRLSVKHGGNSVNSVSFFEVYFHICDKGVTGSPHGGTERIKTKELRKIRPLIKV